MKEKDVQIEEVAAISECEETAKVALLNFKHAFAEDSREDLSKIKETTLLSSKYYSVDRRLIQSEKVQHILAVVLGTGTDPNLVRKNLVPTSLALLIKLRETSLRSVGTTTFKVSCEIRLPVDLGGEVVNIVIEVAPIFATKMIPVTAFIDKSVGSVEFERRRIISGSGRPVPIVSSLPNATMPHIGLVEMEKTKKRPYWRSLS